MHETNAQPGPWWTRFWFWIAVGLLAGMSIGILGTIWSNSENVGEEDTWVLTEALTGPTSPELIETFVTAWERYRSSEYVAVATLFRETSAGATLELPNVVVQQPPRRVSSNGLETVQLNDLGPRTTAEETSLWRNHLEGELPLYRLYQEDNCFHLRLARAIHAPPYGQSATFCFDFVTGALAHSVVVRAEGRDEVVLGWARSNVLEVDFDLVLNNQSANLPKRH